MDDYAIYIVAKPYTEKSAGIKAKYILCESLKAFGLTSHVVPIARDSLKQNLVITKTLHANYLAENRVIVAIYDESIPGNPLNAPVVVRWLLNKPGVIFDFTKTFKKEDLVRVFAEEIDARFPVLVVNTVEYERFIPGISKEKSLSLFYSGKLRSYGKHFNLPENVIEIKRNGKQAQNRDELANLLARGKVLYLAEDSAIALEAALSGCPTVFLEEHFTNPHLNSRFQIGVSKDDSEAALSVARLDCMRSQQFIVSLELRSNYSISELVNSIVKTSPRKVIGQPHHKLGWLTLRRIQINLLYIAVKNHGLRGLVGVLMDSYFVRRKYE